MSDELEDISVDATEPVSVQDVAPSIEPVTPSLSDDEKVFGSNASIGSAEDYNRQQSAEENGLTIGNGGVDGRTVTEAGRQKKAEAEEEKKSQFFEHMEQSEAHRKAWMDKPDHDFGGMKMSGHDLAKLIQFYANNPQMLDKLQERVTNNPKVKNPKEAVEAFKEYLNILEKESKGIKLTEDEKIRKAELSKREDVREVAQAAIQHTKDNGVKFEANNTKAVVTAVTTANSAVASSGRNELQTERKNFNSEASNAKAFESESKSQSAREIFATAPHMTNEFTAKASMTKPASVANDINAGFDTANPATIVAQAQTKPKTMDLSFG